MTYPPAIEKALAYLQAKDIPDEFKNDKMWYAHKFFWKRGIALPPTILADFSVNTLYFGIYGMLMYFPVSLITGLVFRINKSWIASEVMVDLLLWFVAFGFVLAWQKSRERRNLGLLSWKEIQNLPDEKP